MLGAFILAMLQSSLVLSGARTLIKLLCGVLQPDKGQLLMDGVPTRFKSAGHARNIVLGHEPTRRRRTASHEQAVILITDNYGQALPIADDAEDVMTLVSC